MIKLQSTYILLLIAICFSCNFINDVNPGLVSIEKINCPYSGEIKDLCVVNNNVWFLIGDHDFYGNRKSIWVKTSDGGASWQVDSISLLDQDVYGISTFNNKLYIYSWDFTTIDGHPRIYYSENLGMDWILLDSTQSKSRLYFIDENNLVLNDWGNIEISHDRGHSWTHKLPDDSIYGNIFISYFDKVTGYAIGGHSYSPFETVLFKTIDAGETWSRMTGNYPWHSTDNIYFLNPQTGYLFNGDYKNNQSFHNLYKTIDGGTQWFIINENVPENSLLSYFLTEEQGILILEKAIFSTTNGGHSWNKEIYEQSIDIMNRYELIDSKTMLIPYIQNQSYHIMKLTLRF